MSNYSNEEQQVLTKEMSDKIYNDSYSTTEEELQKDTNWIEASKSVYKELEGVEWSGSDEDLAKTGLDMMSRFNYNLTLGTINYTAKLQDADPQTKLSFYYMMDMYDKKDISGNGVLRAFKEMGLDPASYIGIGTLGLGFAGKQATATAAKTGLKAMLKQGAMKFLQSPTAVAATEAGIYTGVDDFARQDAAIGAGVQDEYSPGQTAVATTIGAGVGAGFVQGAKAAGRGISKVIKEGEGEMAKMAGGGTPPNIYQQLTEANRATAPKIPVGKIFKHDIQVVPSDQRKAIDAIIEADTIEDLPYESIEVDKIVPTQRNVTIPNLEKVQGVTDAEDDIIAVEKDGLYYLIDGHHRVSNEILNNSDNVDIRVYKGSK